MVPFPHLVIQDALDSRLAETLRSEYPHPSLVGVDMTLNNNRWDISAHQVNQVPVISSIWKEFIQYHVSQEFWLQVCSIFEKCIPKETSDALGPPSAWKIGVRGQDAHRDKDLLLDAQISGNTPVTQMSSVRGSHLDNGNKLYGGLLYLRDSEDSSSGGNLKIQRWSNFVPRKSRTMLYHEDMHFFVRDVAQIPYSHNTLVFFLNTPNSLHAVTPRSVTSHGRKFVNLVAEFERDMFQVPRNNFASRLSRKLNRAS